MRTVLRREALRGDRVRSVAVEERNRSARTHSLDGQQQSGQVMAQRLGRQRSIEPLAPAAGIERRLSTCGGILWPRFEGQHCGAVDAQQGGEQILFHGVGQEAAPVLHLQARLEPLYASSRRQRPRYRSAKASGVSAGSQRLATSTRREP